MPQVASKFYNIEKCYKILETEQFRKREINPTIAIEVKVQRMLRRIKNVFTERLYTTISDRLETDAFYGNAKVHKLKKMKD